VQINRDWWKNENVRRNGNYLGREKIKENFLF
jgi:hypothetical protein